MRELSSVIKSRKKQKMEKVEKVDEVVEPIDRISDLPEPIIHSILSFLRCPRDVARVSVWSKKWRSIWTSFFILDFDQKNFGDSGGYHDKKFINAVATRLEAMDCIQKFKISLCQPNLKLRTHMNRWIGAAIKKHVQELEIHVEAKSRNHYMLPDAGLSSRKLTSLRLYGCKFNNRMEIDLCNLKELSIKCSQVNADVIHSFIQSCPLIEDLRLVHCKKIGHLNISTLHKLRCLQLYECHGLVSVNIESLSLVSFIYCGKDPWECKVKVTGCDNLKDLTLKDPDLDEELFQELFVKYPNLEKLVLRECNRLKRLTILNSKLKELSVIRCRNLVEANIDAPNLSVLEYSGGRMPLSLTHIAGLHEAKLHICYRKNGAVILHELLDLLRRFENNGDWKLVVTSNKNITIHEELQEIQHLSSNELRIELIKSPMKVKGYVDNLLRMSKPKTLSLVSSSSSELLKFLKDKIMSRENNPKCCTYYSRKCWLHSIKDVTMAVFGRAEIGTSQSLEQTIFKFDWQS
uniref:F-box/LRR-repeat protein At3g03360-like n=1 Tax=Erigeron canadensis TaxID=72917 RepID=UPI001CB94D1F|nr:F-box/LRR-repeat protein At3g03360-like [Erigeron canadensis]